MRTDFPSGDGVELIKLTLKICRNIICVFPKNISNQDIHDLMFEVGAKCLVEKIHLYKKHKLTIIYFGEMFN